MKTIKAYLLGMREFRLGFTTYFSDFGLSTTYDMGRDMAHRLTLRHFEG